MTPGEWIVFWVVVVIVACVAGRMLIRFQPLAGGTERLPLKTHVPVTAGEIELTVKIFGGPDNGEEFNWSFPADTAGFLAALERLKTYRAMKSKVFLAMEPTPHVLVNRGLFLEFANDHVPKPDNSPTTAPSPFRRRHPGV
jgi:hypothetical protein